ncbi:BLUF domain-containing protein [Azospirillum halopraeferens]|uniref:BLUF domain-containing protein n=1 Tax=Azospirillum halopraeferens TaxID=34010 RepID=UPI00042A1137|nr:BLUF domain-containing protein [Azospirillum halopraeferens]
MYLSRLIYFSRPKAPGDSDIESILLRSRSNNFLHGITGVLFYNGRWFVQILEGGRLPVTRLFAAIAADPRHEDVCLVEFTRISERSFADWEMRYIGDGPHAEAVIRRYMPDSFNPETITDGAVMNRLLLALSDAVPAEP